MARTIFCWLIGETPFLCNVEVDAFQYTCTCVPENKLFNNYKVNIKSTTLISVACDKVYHWTKSGCGVIGNGEVLHM